MREQPPLLQENGISITLFNCVIIITSVSAAASSERALELLAPGARPPSTSIQRVRLHSLRCCHHLSTCLDALISATDAALILTKAEESLARAESELAPRLTTPLRASTIPRGRGPLISRQGA